MPRQVKTNRHRRSADVAALSRTRRTPPSRHLRSRKESSATSGESLRGTLFSVAREAEAYFADPGSRPELPGTALISEMPVYRRLTRLSRNSTLDQCFRAPRCHFRRSIRTIEPLRLASRLLSLSQVYGRVPICTPVILKRHSCVRRLPSFSTDRPAFWPARPRATPCWSTRFGPAPGSVQPGRTGDSPRAAESCGP